MKPGTQTDLAFPPALVARIRAAAEDEHRPPADIVREALEDYLETRRWKYHSAQEYARARALGLPDDEGGVTAERRQVMRDKIAEGVRSLRAGKGSDGEAFFAQLEVEFEHLERQGPK